MPYLQENARSNNSGCLMWDHGSQGDMAQHFSSAERKETLKENSMSSKTIFKKDKEIKTFLEGN